MIAFIEKYFAEDIKPGQVYSMFSKTRQNQILGFHG
jgi:hypothetical protein